MKSKDEKLFNFLMEYNDYERIQKLDLNYRFPSFNQIIEDNRRNRYLAAKNKKKEDDRVCVQALNQLEVINNKVDVFIVYREKNRKRDKDNIISGSLKSLFDGVVKSKVLKNDNWKNINNIFVRFELDKENEGVTAYFCELKNDEK